MTRCFSHPALLCGLLAALVTLFTSPWWNDGTYVECTGSCTIENFSSGGNLLINLLASCTMGIAVALIAWGAVHGYRWTKSLKKGS